MTDPTRDPIAWRDGVPYAPRWDDVYYSPDDGAAESRHVFVGGIGGSAAWAGRKLFTVGETGFGTGLNFLVLWQAWRESAAPDARLEFVSVEGFPLDMDELARAHAPFPDLAPLAAELRARWPRPLPGTHRLGLDGGRVGLTLMVGEVGAMLAGLAARADAWFLDGFAPRRNPEMWRREVLEAVARASRPGTRLATFTAAGQVRRDLGSLGFAIERRDGFGRKRECLAGTFEGPSAASPRPWYALPLTRLNQGPVAIIGGGLAGTALARALAGRGVEAVVLERHDGLASEASGNLAGLLEPYLTVAPTPSGRFHALAFEHARRLYDGLGDVWCGRGVLDVARDAKALERMDKIAATPQGRLLARRVDAAEARTLAGVDTPLGGLWFEDGGCVSPVAVCEASAPESPPGIARRLGAEVRALERHQEAWVLRDANGRVLCEASDVVLATGPSPAALWPHTTFVTGACRGQVAFLPAREDGPRAALSFGHYMTPPVPGPDGAPVHVLGSTFWPWEDPSDGGWRELTERDHRDCLEGLDRFLPDLAAAWGAVPLGGRAGLRAVTPDHLPLVGPVHDEAFFRDAYGDLHHGKHWKDYPPAHHHPGLWVLSGLGARGLQTAPLAAEVLAAMMTGGPIPLETDLIEALLPSRYLVRALQKRRPWPPGNFQSRARPISSRKDL